MFGNNPIRKPEKGDGSTLDVQSVFKTFQGEGPNAGMPAIFIRLGGCNLACDFCDTEFESFKNNPLEFILNKVDALSGWAEKPQEKEKSRWTHRLVVVTGGEPLRQPIEPLCDALLERGYKVQIETNGTLYRELNAQVEIICSPKVSHGKYHAIREDLFLKINALKFIVSVSSKAYSNVPELGQSAHHTPVYVQPMDECDEVKNAANLAHAVKLSQEHGYCLSLQLHKIAGVE